MTTSLIGIVLIVLGIVFFIAGFVAPRKQQQSKKFFARYPVNIRQFKSQKPSSLKVIKFKHILGFLLLLLALIYQSSPSLRIEIAFRLGLQERPKPSSLASDWLWKENNQLHPVIANMPPDAEKSIKSVADYIKAKVKDPYEQTKALHDYVASRITYDKKAFEAKRQPRQDAAYVFHKQKAVCTGYANLLVALGKEIDDIDIVKVTGDIREELAEEEGLQTLR
ncbi:MAG: transglutaminase domain-containing protein [Moorea sp. SIO2B7]|nr:transglutaminase domain-containing protein [Moorena sp. SIO2B7]